MESPSRDLLSALFYIVALGAILVVIVAAFMASLKVAVALAATLTPVAPLTGVTLSTVGGVVSGAPVL